jgi:hypothetical protein
MEDASQLAARFFNPEPHEAHASEREKGRQEAKSEKAQSPDDGFMLGKRSMFLLYLS